MLQQILLECVWPIGQFSQIQVYFQNNKQRNRLGHRWHFTGTSARQHWNIFRRPEHWPKKIQKVLWQNQERINKNLQAGNRESYHNRESEALKSNLTGIYTSLFAVNAVKIEDKISIPKCAVDLGIRKTSRKYYESCQNLVEKFYLYRLIITLKVVKRQKLNKDPLIQKWKKAKSSTLWICYWS